ncbi:penicillin-binding transpeptidase domain-containing protein [Fluviispira vulneris]|uniref:penicillin-binding transpeptidase domain-containing protein n=1 Tax=Fluviispira vulneris TaxID=2763012 RepID=UPI0016489E8C|nr:penicillin-binding transpeptidase domain-containing protein [Fluviispira vulneris]
MDFSFSNIIKKPLHSLIVSLFFFSAPIHAQVKNANINSISQKSVANLAKVKKLNKQKVNQNKFKYKKASRQNTKSRYKASNYERYGKNDLKTNYVTAQPVLFSAYSSSYLINAKKLNPNTVKVKAYTDPRESLNNNGTPLNTPFGQVEWPEISNKMFLKNGKIYSYYKNYKLELTIDPQLQDASEKYLSQSRIINGSTAIIDPKSGKILALSQNGGNRNASVSVSSRAPAASLMKIITASAAIEKRNLNPYDEISFRGGCGNLRNGNWLADPSRDKQKMTFAKAFGSSCNTAFARLALYEVGLASLKSYAEKFMFNKPIPSDLKLQTSMFLLPDPDTATPQEVAEAGAGFGATKLNPVHAALLSATVNNHGIMMAPYLVEAAYNSDGKEVYRAKPMQIGRIISQQTALKIETLMLATISSGTSRRTFHKAGTRADANEIGGKTGTLLDPENRDVLYTWFSGIAPLNSPNSIAIGTVVASPQNWVVRASSVAQTTLADYLKFEKNDSRVASRSN